MNDVLATDALLDRLARRSPRPEDLDDPVSAALALLGADVDVDAVPLDVTLRALDDAAMRGAGSEQAADPFGDVADDPFQDPDDPFRGAATPGVRLLSLPDASGQDASGPLPFGPGVSASDAGDDRGERGAPLGAVPPVPPTAPSRTAPGRSVPGRPTSTTGRAGGLRRRGTPRVIDLDEARRTAPAPRSVRISPLAGVAVAVGVLVVGGGVSAVALGGIGNGIERVASVWSDEPAVTTDELQDRLREARRALEAGQLQRADQLVSDVVTQAARLDPADERRVREEAAEVRRSLADARRRAASRTTRTDANGRSPARESPAGRVEPAGGPTTAPRSPTDGPGVGGSVAAGKVTGTFGATDAGGVRGTGTLGVGTDGASLTGRATVPVADGVTVTLRATLTSDPSGSISGSLDTVDDTVDDTVGARVGGSAGHKPAGKPDRRP